MSIYQFMIKWCRFTERSRQLLLLWPSKSAEAKEKQAKAAEQRKEAKSEKKAERTEEEIFLEEPRS